MTHILPPHADLNIQQHSSISSALAMEQQGQLSPQDDGHPGPAPTTSARKRKKNTADGDDAHAPSEPRRLRRSHEACARCRSKKIKCDSKHPKCTACATAGAECCQEDRHRQTLTPRGYTERLERQLIQCQALLKRHVPGFESLDDLENILLREGITIDMPAPGVATPYQFTPPGSTPSAYPGRQDGPKGYPYPPQHMMPPYGHPMGMPPPGYPPNAPYPMPLPPGGFNPHVHPAYQHPPPQPSPTAGSSSEIKGQDPQSNDMSNTEALAKNFGVSAAIVHDLKLGTPAPEIEDLAVGSGGLSSGRDRELTETNPPRDVSIWHCFSMRRSGQHMQSPASVWLPKNRQMVKHIVNVYFTHLDFHRPTFNRPEFEQTLDALYDGHEVQHDPGFVCSVYLVLTLGTMSELHRNNGEKDPVNTVVSKKLSEDWPEHGEFFERALAVKPDLRVTVSSLQALILLQWFLFTERQGRSLWRLVGSLVRLAVELGLHHDPTLQVGTFSEEECQLRICLWQTVMVHDRGTSILLGRPLAIAPSDSNTPSPQRWSAGPFSQFSDHFLHSGPVADIQAEIINSLYKPTKSTPEQIMTHATRIIKHMVDFERSLPDSYRYYFRGTEDWSAERKAQLVEKINDSEGLTLLKLGIARILMLRALFSNKDLPFPLRHKALVDAITVSHNIINIHYQLIKYPDIAFFVSPIPLHITAMVILYGHMSRCDRLPPQVAIEDIWMALDMLPRFRWRWERKDLNGGHPLIAKLAEKVFEINLRDVSRTGMSALLPEVEWDTDSPMGIATPTSAGPKGSVTTPTPTRLSIDSAYGNGESSSVQEHGGRTLADVPPALFWHFDPQNPVGLNMNHARNVGDAAMAQQYSTIGMIGYQSSPSDYIVEEKDQRANTTQMQKLVNGIDEHGWNAVMQQHERNSRMR